MSELSQVQYGYFAAMFLIMSLVAQVGKLVAVGSEALLFRVMSLIALVGAALCLGKILHQSYQHKRGETA